MENPAAIFSLEGLALFIKAIQKGNVDDFVNLTIPTRTPVLELDNEEDDINSPEVDEIVRQHYKHLGVDPSDKDNEDAEQPEEEGINRFSYKTEIPRAKEHVEEILRQANHPLSLSGISSALKEYGIEWSPTHLSRAMKVISQESRYIEKIGRALYTYIRKDDIE